MKFLPASIPLSRVVVALCSSCELATTQMLDNAHVLCEMTRHYLSGGGSSKALDFTNMIARALLTVVVVLGTLYSLQMNSSALLTASSSRSPTPKH